MSAASRIPRSSPAAALPVAPSAVPITGSGMMAMTADGKMVPYETPRALETGEVAEQLSKPFGRPPATP